MNLLRHRLPESRLNYIATIGETFEHETYHLNNHNTIIFFGNDAFIFETDMFVDGKESGMWLFKQLNTLPRVSSDFHLYLFLLSGDYSETEFDGINAFAETSKVVLSDYKVNLVKAKFTEKQKEIRISHPDHLFLYHAYQPIKKETIDIDHSGFMMKTPNGSNIFNMLIVIGDYLILITVVMRGFISREITTSIIETIRDIVRSGNFFRLPQEDSLIHFPWCDYPYDSLKEIMSAETGFLYKLKQNDTMQKAFEKLEDKNILINVRVIGKTENL